MYPAGSGTHANIRHPAPGERRNRWGHRNHHPDYGAGRI